MRTRSQGPDERERRRPSPSKSLPPSGRYGDAVRAATRNLSVDEVAGIRTRRSADGDSPKVADSPSLKSAIEATPSSKQQPPPPPPPSSTQQKDSMSPASQWRRQRHGTPWSCSLLTLAVTAVAFTLMALIGHSFMNRQVDPKGCAMSYMRPAFAKFSEFDTEHTRFASKYSLYLYREGGVDEDTRVSCPLHADGVPAVALLTRTAR